MKSSQLMLPTLREEPSEAELISHKLLLRAGMIRKVAGGMYTYLPLGYRIIKKIIEIVREEMDAAGGQEVGLPMVQPRELWDQSGRWQLYGNEMFRLKDRHDRDFCLGPTHEELITSLVNTDVHSYRDLPLMLYQIQDKFRDEIRPRFGLMRAREFIMKDLYSFDTDEEGMNLSYRKMYFAYCRIFERLGLEYRVVEADSGAIGGSVSHEYMVLAENGESSVVYCDTCDYAANIEKAECTGELTAPPRRAKPRAKIHTPGIHTVEDVAAFLKINIDNIIKTMIYWVDGRPVAVLVRGDREVNEIKVKNYFQAQDVILARDEHVKEITGVYPGSVGPVGLKIEVLADWEVGAVEDGVCGANKESYHYEHVVPGRDFEPSAYGDFRNAAAGDKCPRCEGKLNEVRGIEVGHIFQLGTKYSEPMNATFLDEAGNQRPFVMGCYGIGISRTMAAAVEQNYDENGIIWPLPIAPFQVIIVPVNMRDREQAQAAEQVYQELRQKNIEVLWDDRDERAGVKFKDADLIGIPIRVTIGPKSLKEGKIELKKRWENDSELVALSDAVARISEILNQNRG